MADPVTAGSTVAATPIAPKTTTGKTLWILCVVLLIVTAVVFGTSLWVFLKVHRTIEAVRSTTAPAIFEILTAKEALVKADSAVIGSFQSGDVKLSGPGLQHQNQITFAIQSLTQVAEHNAAAGNVGSQRIQLIEGLLEAYSGLIEQAHAHFGTAVGTADLWSASRLLHAGDSPILTELDALLEDQTHALNDQISASSMTTGTLLVWVIPIVFLFVLLSATQIFMKRQFRRAVNPSLLLATVVLIGLFLVTFLAFASQRQLENSRATLSRVVAEWDADTLAADAQGQHALGRLVTRECSQERGGCGPTVSQFTNREPTDSTAGEARDGRAAVWRNDVEKQTGPAARNSRLWFIIPLTAALIAVLIPSGLWPRIEEYRYRSR